MSVYILPIITNWIYVMINKQVRVFRSEFRIEKCKKAQAGVENLSFLLMVF